MKTNSLEFDAQALREKILDLAMRGKLVKQDPTNEPASVLLEKIKAEKAELVKEGKIKKSKSLPEITDTEKPFDIPDSWEWVRLGEVTSVGNSISVKPADIKYNKPLIELADIESYTANLINEELTTDSIKSSKLQYHKGDVLFAKLRPYLKKILIAPNDGYCTSELLPINGYIIENYWIYSSLLSNMFFKQIEKQVQGINLPRINPTKMKNMIIPLPPLEEQSRIAAKIAELFALLRKVESSNQQYDEFKKMLRSKVLDLAMRGKLVEQNPDDEPASVLLKKIKAEKVELVKEGKIKKSKSLPKITDEEKPFDIPDSWEWVRLGEITQSIRYGFTTSASDIGNSAFVRITDIQNGNVNWDSIPKCTVPEDKLKDLSLKNNDILIARTGGTVGKSFMVTNLPYTAIFASYLIRVRMNSKLSNYLEYILDSPLYWNYISSKKSGTGQPNVNATKLSEIILPLPPLEEQSKLIKQINNIYSII